jgi:hypothetical protein
VSVRSDYKYRSNEKNVQVVQEFRKSRQIQQYHTNNIG